MSRISNSQKSMQMVNWSIKTLARTMKKFLLLSPLASSQMIQQLKVNIYFNKKKSSSVKFDFFVSLDYLVTQMSTKDTVSNGRKYIVLAKDESSSEEQSKQSLQSLKRLHSSVISLTSPSLTRFDSSTSQKPRKLYSGELTNKKGKKKMKVFFHYMEESKPAVGPKESAAGSSKSVKPATPASPTSAHPIADEFSNVAEPGPATPRALTPIKEVASPKPSK